MNTSSHSLLEQSQNPNIVFSSKFGELGQQYLKGVSTCGTLRTVAPDDYYPPNDEDIKSEAASVGLQTWSPGFVRDLCNIAAGGFSAPSALIAEGVPLFVQEDELIGKKINTIVKHQSSIAELLETLHVESYPGVTPLQKAVSFLHFIPKADSALDPSDDGIAIPAFITALKSAGAKSKQILDLVESLDDDERQLLISDREENVSTTLLSTELALTRKVAEELLTELLKQEIAKIALLLRNAPEMGIRGETRTDIISGGNRRRTRRIKNENELSLISLNSWALFEECPDLFFLKLTQRELVVQERVTFRGNTDKQLLYVLLDVSGSMNKPKKISVALGVLANRLQGVMKGEAELYYRFFDGGVSNEFHARTRKDATDAMKRLFKTNFSGGDTNIDNALVTGLAEIKKKMDAELTKFIKPDLAIITDGADSVHLRDLGQIRLHSFFCAGGNSVLKQMSASSGGLVFSLS